MKVLMIDHWSNSNPYSLELSNELGRLCDVELLTVQDSAAQTNNESYKVSKELLGYGGGNSLENIVRYLKSLLGQFKKSIYKNVDVVHIQSYRRASIEIPLYVFFRPLIKKLMITVHNVLPHESKKIDYLLFKTIYKISDNLIVHNNVTKKELIERFKLNEDKIIIIPHGVYSVENIQTKKNMPSIKNNFLFFGMIREYKGLDILVNALSILPKEITEIIDVKIVGKNYLDINIADLIKSHNIDNFVKVEDGFIPDEEVEGYFNWSDAIILPYKHISGSGALLLSYSYCKPVIVSDLPTFIEETDNGSTGLLFKTNDPKDLANKIVDFVKLDLITREHLSRNINDVVTDKYSWGKSAFKIFSLYS